jgi:hypothetical protein
VIQADFADVHPATAATISIAMLGCNTIQHPQILDPQMRWDLKFYHWALVLAWSSAAIATISFGLTSKQYRAWGFDCAIMLSIPWFYVVSTRFFNRPVFAFDLGAKRRHAQAMANSGIPPLRFVPPRIVRWIALGSIPLLGGLSLHQQAAWVNSIGFILAAVFTCLYLIGTVVMVGCYVIWFTTGNKDLANGFLRFGLVLVIWSMVLFPVACLFMARDAP